MFRQREASLRQSAVGRWMIRNQHFLYFPLLGFARARHAAQLPAARAPGPTGSARRAPRRASATERC